MQVVDAIGPEGTHVDFESGGVVRRRQFDDPNPHSSIQGTPLPGLLMNPTRALARETPHKGDAGSNRAASIPVDEVERAFS